MPMANLEFKTPSELLDDIIRLRGTLERIERGATSVLLDASLKNNPISPDVLHEIVKEIRATLSNGVRTPE